VTREHPFPEVDNLSQVQTLTFASQCPEAFVQQFMFLEYHGK